MLLSSPTGARISGDGARMDIPRLKESDIGRYTCSARNDAGSAEASVDIDVLVPPRINRENVDMNPRLPSQQTLTLHCEVTGKPNPTLKWFRGEQEITSGEKMDIAGDGRYLQISNIGLEEVGAYKCVAENEAGTDELIYSVEVVEGPIIRGGGTIQVVEGEPAEIVCTAEGTPTPDVLWQRNGQRLDTRERYIVSEAGLKITEASSQDAGIYVCVATNEVGTAQQAYTLEVLVPPKIAVFSPEELSIPLRRPLELKCGARGYPDPDIEWFKDSISLTGNPRYSVDDFGSLRLEQMNPEDVGQYKCIASNAAGEDEKQNAVKVIRPPKIGEGGVKILNVTQGDPAQFLCEVEGEPKPQIAWYKDKGPLNLYSNPTMSLEEADSVFEIGDSRLTDAGDYECVAMNSAGNATQNFRLNVGVPPRITEEPRKVTVAVGSQATIPCEAVGVPEPEISYSPWSQ